MKKFLITGANGQVGFCLNKQLQGVSNVLALERDKLDITDRNAVFNIVKDFRPDVIINAAAYTAVEKAESEIELARAVNVNGAKYLAEAASEIDALMLHISTDYVFNGMSSKPYTEDETPDPQTVYGRTKLEGEIAVQNANTRSIILRTAWVFGECGNNFVKTMLRLAEEGKEFNVVSDQFGAPTYADDISAALIDIANQIIDGKNDSYGIYHFSGQPYVSWYDFAESIFQQAVLQKILKKAPLVNAISTSDYPSVVKRPANSCLDLNKIQQTFGIKPSNWHKALTNLHYFE
ncbi:dTDP-4-dehydrorhamnose reductase [Mannheimia varigena USDA-ARS-USMARC-1296]|uniref:dTDP-4-dehydrorhamnose reductase n=1 Tax=Mannheimia varigena USDA-ARS-USMARC-1296 TaxID=1433287 RepID=W0QC89_9PAST|nr:dTDP-4-dehydrorhamnose reductase [Mannheimia varigena]AHG74833.1 dTDP-4-dehydrorhamnose reductase [Mannheimia varigena USDA-ARS-USMARC-1296]